MSKAAEGPCTLFCHLRCQVPWSWQVQTITAQSRSLPQESSGRGVAAIILSPAPPTTSVCRRMSVWHRQRHVETWPAIWQQLALYLAAGCLSGKGVHSEWLSLSNASRHRMLNIRLHHSIAGSLGFLEARQSGTPRFFVLLVWEQVFQPASLSGACPLGCLHGKGPISGISEADCYFNWQRTNWPMVS